MLPQDVISAIANITSSKPNAITPSGEQLYSTSCSVVSRPIITIIIQGIYFSIDAPNYVYEDTTSGICYLTFTGDSKNIAPPNGAIFGWAFLRLAYTIHGESESVSQSWSYQSIGRGLSTFTYP